MRTCWSVCSCILGHFRGFFFPKWVCIRVYVCVCVEAMIGSLRHPVLITSSSGVQFIFMTFFFFPHKSSGAWRPRLQAAAFGDSTLVQKGHSMEKALTAPTASVPLHEWRGPFRLYARQRVCLSLSASPCLSARLRSFSSAIKQSLTIDAFTPLSGSNFMSDLVLVWSVSFSLNIL